LPERFDLFKRAVRGAFSNYQGRYPEKEDDGLGELLVLGEDPQQCEEYWLSRDEKGAFRNARKIYEALEASAIPALEYALDKTVKHEEGPTVYEWARRIMRKRQPSCALWDMPFAMRLQHREHDEQVKRARELDEQKSNKRQKASPGEEDQKLIIGYRM
jgi:hypothetical protein